MSSLFLHDVETAIREIVYGDDETARGYVDEQCETFEDLWALHRARASHAQAGWKLKEAVEAAMIRDLGDEAIRIDDMIVRVVKEPPARRIKDPAGLAQYLELSAGALLVFRTTDLKMQGLNAWAIEQGDDPDEIESRFFEFVGEEGPPELRINRMEYAPYWALGLKNGERMRAPERKRVAP